MNIRPMVKRCIHCRRTYTYNPSAGNFGAVCKHCGKMQIKLPCSKKAGKKERR